MLYNGRFIKEPPPKIGVYYTPPRNTGLTPEEAFAQGIILGVEQKKYSVLSKVFGFILKL